MLMLMLFFSILFFIFFMPMFINMNISIEVLGFSPNKSRANCSFNRERSAITETPLKNSTKQAIDGVMLGIPLKVGIKSTVPFDGDDGREIEFTGFKGFTRSTMGTMSFSR